MFIVKMFPYRNSEEGNIEVNYHWFFCTSILPLDDAQSPPVFMTRKEGKFDNVLAFLGIV
jgi:hypothetical protein